MKEVWISFPLLAGILLSPFAQLASRTRLHELIAGPHNVHWGYFSAALQPAVRIQSGDIVVIEDTTRVEPQVLEQAGIPSSQVPENHRAIYRDVKDRGPGPHILVGPVYVEGAEPGDVLEVRVLNVELAYDYGYNRHGPKAGAAPEAAPDSWLKIIRIDRKAKTAEIAPGVVVPLTRPFFGTMGVAPDPSAGRISSVAPGPFGGNLDNKDLGAGAILYIPVHARGALFSAGDGHAAQGHGEVNVNAIEAGLRGRFQFVVRKDMKLKWPRAETPTHWIVMGLHEDLDEAMKLAVEETIDFLVERFPRLTRSEAYMIASVAVDYHITQAVDRTKGIHGMIPKSIFHKAR